MNDIKIAKIVEPEQTVVVLVGDGYIAAEINYGNFGTEKSTPADAVVLFGFAGASRMITALRSAIDMEMQIVAAAESTADGK